jgi:hypothetical protein
MLVFEPVLSVVVDVSVRIDGLVARLDVIPIGGRVAFRVQLLLDRVREISIG